MHNKIIILLTLAAAILSASCTKEEGEGGTGCIEGKVYMVIHDDDNYLLTTDTIVAAKQDVFIIYGDDTFVGDDTETGDDGAYRFRYLNAGTYTVYAYSEDNLGERTAVKKSITIARGETGKVEDIYIHTGKAYGTSMIHGWVWAEWFNKNGVTIDSSWAYEQRVYIRRKDEHYHFDDVRVSDDGSYFFQKLQPDTYIIYTYSQKPSNEVLYPVYDTVVVDTRNTVVTADTMRVKLKA